MLKGFVDHNQEENFSTEFIQHYKQAVAFSLFWFLSVETRLLLFIITTQHVCSTLYLRRNCQTQHKKWSLYGHWQESVWHYQICRWSKYIIIIMTRWKTKLCCQSIPVVMRFWLKKAPKMLRMPLKTLATRLMLAICWLNIILVKLTRRYVQFDLVGCIK